MIRSFRSKGLAELWNASNTKRIDSKMHRRILVRLDRLNAATTTRELDLPGFDFHALKGTSRRATRST